MSSSRDKLKSLTDLTPVIYIYKMQGGTIVDCDANACGVVNDVDERN
jgi:hypothetical protein